MKQLIHIDNYESFYLDYLEGTLSAEERTAFEEFLAAHPELQVDEELILLDDAPELLDPLQKSLLKKEEFSSVSAENLDYFAIGKVEQVLSPQEEQVFDTYTKQHPETQQLVRAYEETRLKASKVVYPNKEALKEKEVTLIPWRLIAGTASAAALLLLFFQLGFKHSKETSTTPTVARKGKQEQQTDRPDKNQAPELYVPAPEAENTGFVAQKNTIHPLRGLVKNPSGNDPKQEAKKETEQPLPLEPGMEKNLVGERTPQPHHPTILPQVKDDKQPVSPSLNPEVNQAPSKDLAAHTGNSSNMKNPIPLITSTLSETTNTPVDFKTGKATKTEKGGFFLKIGKFEVSHKSSKKN